MIVLDNVIQDAILSGNEECGLRAREFCSTQRLAAAEEDAAAQSALDGKGGRAAKGGGRRMCKSLHISFYAKNSWHFNLKLS